MHTNASPVKRYAGDIICCLLLLLFCLAIGAPRYDKGLDLRDEGFLAYGAVRVLAGQIPNRDFVSYQPPLSFYSLAAMFRIFGVSILTLRTLGLFIYIAIVLLVYLLSRRMAGKAVAFCAALPAAYLGMPFFHFVPFAVWQGMFFSLLSALLVITAMQTGNYWLSFAGGLATALAMISRQDQGIYLSAAVLIYAMAVRFARPDPGIKPRLLRFLCYWGAGALALIVPLGIFWLASGAVPFMIRQLIVFPVTDYARTSSIPMPRFVKGAQITSNVITGLFYLPPLIFAVTALALLIKAIRRRFLLEHAHATFILAFSIFFYCQVLTRSDLYHLLITLDPFFVLCAWWLNKASYAVRGIVPGSGQGQAKNMRTVFISTALILALTAGAGFWFFSLTKETFIGPRQQKVEPLSIARGGVQLNPEYALSLKSIITEIEILAKPDQSILCLPYQPMYYFLSQRNNPTRWNYIWPGDETPEDYRTLIEEVRHNPPAVVLISGKSGMGSYAASVLEYVEKHYDTLSYNPGLTVYIRRRAYK